MKITLSKPARVSLKIVWCSLALLVLMMSCKSNATGPDSSPPPPEDMPPSMNGTWNVVLSGADTLGTILGFQMCGWNLCGSMLFRSGTYRLIGNYAIVFDGNIDLTGTPELNQPPEVSETNLRIQGTINSSRDSIIAQMMVIHFDATGPTSSEHYDFLATR